MKKIINIFYSMTLGEVEKKLKTNFGDGLTLNEVEKRKLLFGENILPRKKRQTIFSLFFSQFNNLLVYTLFLAVILKFVLSEYIDALIIFIVLLVNAIIGAFQEGRAETIMENLQAYVRSELIVVRSGKRQIISEKELVPGDICFFEEGSRVGADFRIIKSENLKIDESVLTGESRPIKKNSKRISKKNILINSQTNILFAGTYIVSGTCTAVVIFTGYKTEMGKLNKIIGKIDTEIPLKKDFEKLSRLIVFVAAVAIIIIFFLGYFWGKTLNEMFFILTALFVAIVPEGLPIVVTVVLAVGVNRMAKSKVLIKRLPAVETLGRIEVLIVDKTGTLTRNEQIISDAYLKNKYYSITGSGYHPRGKIYKDKILLDKNALNKDFLNLATIGLIFDKSELKYEKQIDSFKLIGEPIQAAFGVFSAKVGLKKKEVNDRIEILKEIPFSSQNNFHAIFINENNNKKLLMIGAPETILSRCVGPKAAHKKILNEMLKKGLRVVAVAEKKISSTRTSLKELNFLAFLGMQDSIREDVSQTVKELRALNIRIAMATGDHKETAFYVASESGIIENNKMNKISIDGEALTKMSKNDIDKNILNKLIFSRVTPENKMQIIDSFHRKGIVVGMTGDGVNDAPALMSANVGIAMGKGGTDVARDSADIVLLDNSLKSIHLGVLEGRHIFSILRRVCLHLLATSAGELLIISIAIIANMPLPLLAVQLLWQNLIADSFLDSGLSMEPRIKSKQDDGFYKTTLFDKNFFLRISFIAILMTIVSLSVFIYYKDTDLVLARTMLLITMTMFHWFNAWSLRSDQTSIFKLNLFSNLWLIGATVIVIVLQFAAIYIPFMQSILKTVPLTINQWIIATILGSSIIFFEEFRKFYIKYSNKKKLNI